MTVPPLPPCVALPLSLLKSTVWSTSPLLTVGSVSVHAGRSADLPVDPVKVTAVFPGVAPSTIMCVYSWNQRDAGDMTSPMNAVDTLRIAMHSYGRTKVALGGKALARIVAQRGGKHFRKESKSAAWVAAEGLPPPSDTESMWRSVSRIKIPMISNRDWIWRKEDPMKLSAEQAAGYGFNGETWATGMLPGSGVPSQRDCVRAVGYRWGVAVEDIGDGSSRLTLVAAMDLGGALPAFVASTTNQRLAEFVMNIGKQALRIVAANGGRQMLPSEFLAINPIPSKL